MGYSPVVECVFCVYSSLGLVLEITEKLTVANNNCFILHKITPFSEEYSHAHTGYYYKQ